MRRSDIVTLLHHADGQLGLAVHRGEGDRDEWKREASQLISRIRAAVREIQADERQEPRARVIRFTCEQHGDIWSGAVWCQHDIDTTIRDVMDGHRKPYGRDCDAAVTVDLLDPDTMQPLSTETRRHLRGGLVGRDDNQQGE